MPFALNHGPFEVPRELQIADDGMLLQPSVLKYGDTKKGLGTLSPQPNCASDSKLSAAELQKPGKTKLCTQGWVTSPEL